MARIIDTSNTNVIPLAEFIGAVESRADLESEENIVAAASDLRALSNNPDLVANAMASVLKDHLEGRRPGALGAQSLVLGRGRGFYVRLNIWPAVDLPDARRSPEARLFSYLNTHDHNFRFLTVGCLGPGYTTDLYRHNRENVLGKVGEAVALQFVETVKLVPGRVIVFEAMRDVHTQYPPERLSASINIMVDDPESIEQDQYCFDPVSGGISELPEIALVYLRASVVSLASSLVSAEDFELVSGLITGSPCRRLRAAAIAGLCRSASVPDGEKAKLFEIATQDRDEIVRDSAKDNLLLLRTT